MLRPGFITAPDGAIGSESQSRRLMETSRLRYISSTIAKRTTLTVNGNRCYWYAEHGQRQTLRVRHIVEPRYFTVWLVSAISVLLRSNESRSRI